MKKLLVLLIFGILLLNIASAEVQTLGVFKQRETINLIQTCDNSTYSNVTRVTYPNGNFVINEHTKMTKVGSNYNYSLLTTEQLGQYIVYGECDENGVITTWVYDFDITPSGEGESLIGLFIIIFLVCYGTLALGFLIKNQYIALFGALLVLILGVFTYKNGIDVYKNFMTEIISFVSIGVGAILSLLIPIEMITENY